MRIGRLSVPLLLLLTSPFASQAAEVGYSCVNSQEGHGSVRPEFRDALDVKVDLKLAEPLLEKQRKLAWSDYERALVDIALGATFFATGRSEQAAATLEPLLMNPFLPRAQLDLIRTQLAQIAGQRKDIDRVVALLEPMFLAKCAPLPLEASYLLADALLHKQRSRDALNVLDEAIGKSAKDGDWWRAAHTELHCKLDGPAVCVGWVGRLAAQGGLSAELIDVLNTLLASVLSNQEAGPALAEAKAGGVIDASGRVVPRPAAKVEDLVPITRHAPIYPRDAIRKLASGFVDIQVCIVPDGKVKVANVLNSSPKGMFDDAALRAIRQWTFKPQVVNGVPVGNCGIQRIVFQMAPS